MKTSSKKCESPQACGVREEEGSQRRSWSRFPCVTAGVMADDVNRSTYHHHHPRIHILCHQTVRFLSLKGEVCFYNRCLWTWTHNLHCLMDDWWMWYEKKSLESTWMISLTSTSFLPWWNREITKYHDIYFFLLAFTIKSKLLIHSGLLKWHLNPSTFKTKNKHAAYLPGKSLTTSSKSCLLRKQLLP